MKKYKQFIAKEDIELIHENTIRILENVGVKFEHEEALEIFRKHGIRVEGDVVYMGEKDVRTALSTVPETFTLYSGRGTVEVGDGSMVKLPVGCPAFIEDHGNIRKILNKDIIDLFKLIDTSPLLDCNHVNFFTDLAMAGLTFWQSTFPGYNTLVVIYILYGFFTTATLWSPYICFVRHLGTEEEQGKLFDVSEAMRGVVSAVTGFVFLWMLGLFVDSVGGMQVLLWISVGLYVIFAAGVLGGILADKAKSRAIFISGLLGGIIVCAALLIFSSSLVTVAIVITMVMSFLYFTVKSVYYSVMGEGGIPLELTAAATGIISFIAYAPEAFMTTIMGSWIDADPVMGFNKIFIWMISFSVISILLCRFVREIWSCFAALLTLCPFFSRVSWIIFAS